MDIKIPLTEILVEHALEACLKLDITVFTSQNDSEATLRGNAADLDYFLRVSMGYNEGLCRAHFKKIYDVLYLTKMFEIIGIFKMGCSQVNYTIVDKYNSTHTTCISNNSLEFFQQASCYEPNTHSIQLLGVNFDNGLVYNV